MSKIIVNTKRETTFAGVTLMKNGELQSANCAGLGPLKAAKTTEISFFLGGHRVGVSHVYDRLKKNKRLLKSNGIHVLDGDAARRAVSAAVTAFNNHKPIEQVKSDLLAAIEADNPKHKSVVVICDGMSGQVQRPMAGNTFYPAAARRTEILTKILSPYNLKFFLGLRNPATFIPSAWGTALMNGSVIKFEDFIEPASIRDLRWAYTLERILPEAPKGSLHVWRIEDYADIWRDLIGAMTGLKITDDLTQNTKPLNTGLSFEGSMELYNILSSSPDIDDEERQQVAKDLLKSHPSSDAHSDHLLWGTELVEDLTYRYNDDWYYIERMEDVVAISPAS